MIEALVEVVLEILGEVLSEILAPIFSGIRLPKWLKILLLALFAVALLGGVIFAFIYGWSEIGLAGLLACLACIAFPFLIWLIVAYLLRLRHGTLRPAKKEDLSEILKMYRSVIGTPGCHWTISYPNEATLYEDFSTGNLFVLRRGRKLIGAGSIVPKNELDDLLCWWHRENVREIARIVVAPQFHGKGHGKHLIHKLCQKLRKSKVQAVHILVSNQNNHAKHLYRKCGFFSRGEVHRFDHDYFAYERKL